MGQRQQHRGSKWELAKSINVCVCVCNRPSSYIDTVFNCMWQLWQRGWGEKLVGWHSRIELGSMMGGCFIPSSLSESEKAACMWVFSCKFAFRTSFCWMHMRQLWLTSFKRVFFPKQSKRSQRLNTKKSVHFSKCGSHNFNGKNICLASGNFTNCRLRVSSKQVQGTTHPSF